MAGQSSVRTFFYEKYTVGIICALPVELGAVRATLDEIHGPLLKKPHDSNHYEYGEIGQHNVVLTCLPAGLTGNSSAASVATHLLRSFVKLRFALLVGIAGGVPESGDIRLGDVVVSKPIGQYPGIVKFDFGKTIKNGEFERTGSLDKPAKELLSVLPSLPPTQVSQKVSAHVSNTLSRQDPGFQQEYRRPNPETDVLFAAGYQHADDEGPCSNCDRMQQILRPPRQNGDIRIHYGLVASADQVMRHGETRDKLHSKLPILCVEMEAAGLMDVIPCLVIRGICDYADTHKHKIWQPYASLSAASFARELLKNVPLEIEDLQFPTSQDHARNDNGVCFPGARQDVGAQAFAPLHDSGIWLPEFRQTGYASPLSASRSQDEHGTPPRSQETQFSRLGMTASVVRPEVMQECNQAWQEIKVNLTAEQFTLVERISAQDLKLSLLDIQAEQAVNNKIMNLTRIRQLLEMLDELKKASNGVASLHLKSIWGCIRYLMQTASSSPEAFDALLATYQEIGKSIATTQAHISSANNRNIKPTVDVAILTDIHILHQSLVALLGFPDWIRIFGAVWKSVQGRLLHLKQDILNLKDLGSCETELQISEFVQERSRAWRLLENIEKDELAPKYQDVSRWLQGANTREDQHSYLESYLQVRRDASSGGNWLLNDDRVKPWIQDDVPKEPIFWLEGVPGAGKTVLASVVVDHLLQDKESRTAFFFCKDGDLDRSKSFQLIKSLAKQLLVPDRDLIPWIYDQYCESDRSTLQDERKCKMITRILLLNSPAKKTFIVVDGLDEFEGKQRKEALQFLTEMTRQADIQNPGMLRVMIISRDEPDIKGLLRSYTKLSLSAEDVQGDISSYVKFWCKRLHTRFEEITEGDIDFLDKWVLDRAQGMFLFAKLVMQNLYDQCDYHSFEQEIQKENFPDGLDGIYERTLLRITDAQPNTAQAARKILGWMACAMRPLKWREIQCLASVYESDSQEWLVDEARRPLINLREVCGSLVSELPGGRLDFVHVTTKEYLFRKGWIQKEQVNRQLCALCLGYLMVESFDSELDSDRCDQLLLEGSSGFEDYAAAHWSDHVSAVSQSLSDPAHHGHQSLDQVDQKLDELIEMFVGLYRFDDQIKEDHNKEDPHCKRFEAQKYADLFSELVGFVSHYQMGIRAEYDKIQPEKLQKAVTRNRAALESAEIGQLAAQRDLLHEFYGSGWFKCPKTTCYYFHEGFQNGEARKKHVDFHDRPYRCIYPDCERGFVIGFQSKKQLDKHRDEDHPELNKNSRFSRLRALRINASSREKKPKLDPLKYKFVCDHCEGEVRFARREILAAHVRSKHISEKPHKCPTCELRFVRKGDMSRHMKNHDEEKKFVCGGDCGKSFPRRDALQSHWRSERGQRCRELLDG